ncbi:3-(3-hydroxy-phenyl)propionate/3-hydroxycinnamic acid hydroxylase [Streptomyces sp. RB17]|uniref:bifunctional 3-(3-hydroxy-phenyl)propionate/3-hydroxycinnamic acid hydroxylase MhpA n=1 Tax=Streptomyces sp. RB17 TaxID=2585197 RepID=UPI0012974D04|nr:bifunctional 3-(3-hydroxy-phenyl)propionate/3-hydroxycinnamic acid hydroxylase [Streptomyces sp. RB17]MQY38736.1 3-(3-hydroxy-phenyl)propionate/3-hydroxycinnamic acid hydroxylase [Streptomyces sp. RB17]
MSQHTDVDVVIVGYGPVGQYLSYKLGRLGWTSVCIERHSEAYAFPRAVHFDDEIARLFNSIGLDADTTPAIQQFDVPYRWVNADKEVLLELVWRGRGRSGWNVNNFFYQPHLEREINDIVATQTRTQVLRGWEAVEVVQDDSVATVAARPHEGGPDSETRSFRCQYVVGADGANSFVRNNMAVTTTDLGFAFDWLIVDLLPHEPLELEARAWQWCRPERPTTVIPGGSPHRQRFEFMRLPGETVEELNTARTAWRLVGEFGLTPDNAVLERHVVYTFGARWSDRWRDGRLFIAGDAAHLTPPFAGQGMCAGIRDAENLAWKLDAVLRKKAPDSLLDTYGPERIEHVRHVIELCVGLGQVICVTDPQAAAVRDARMKAALQDPELAPAPPPLPRLGAGLTGSHPEAGYVSYHGRVTAGGVSGRFDDVLGHGWTVLGRPGAFAPLPHGTRAWANDYGLRLVEVGEGAPVSDDEGVYAAWFDDLDADAVVIRPDFYVYDACAAQSLDAVLCRLRSSLVVDDVTKV